MHSHLSPLTYLPKRIKAFTKPSVGSRVCRFKSAFPCGPSWLSNLGAQQKHRLVPPSLCLAAVKQRRRRRLEARDAAAGSASSPVCCHTTGIGRGRRKSIFTDDTSHVENQILTEFSLLPGKGRGAEQTRQRELPWSCTGRTKPPLFPQARGEPGHAVEIAFGRGGNEGPPSPGHLCGAI